MRIAMVSEHASPLAARRRPGRRRAERARRRAGGCPRPAGPRRPCLHPPRRPRPARRASRPPPGTHVLHVPAGPARPLPKDELLPHMGEFADWLTAQLAGPDAGRRPRPLLDERAGRLHDRAADVLGLPRLRHLPRPGHRQAPPPGGRPTPARPSGWRLERAVGRSADRVVATCSDEVRELVRLGVPADRATVVPCRGGRRPASPRTRTGPRSPPRTRPAPAADRGPPRDRKGFAVVVEALPACPDAELLVVGGADRRAAATDASPAG